MKRKSRHQWTLPALAVIAVSVCAATSFAAPSEPAYRAPIPIPSSLTPEEAVRLAMQSRPVVAAAQSEVDAREAKVKAARTSDPLRLLVGRGTDAAPGATDNDLALSQTIDWFGRNRLAASVAESEANVARANLRRVRLGIQSEVLAAFNQVVAAEGKVVIGRELVGIAIRFRDAAKRRVETGQAPEVQLLRANIEVERATQALELREAEAKAAKNRLLGAIGSDGGAANGFFSRDGSPQPRFDQRLPDVLVLSAELQVLDAQIRQEGASNRPEIEFQVRRSPWMDNAQIGLRLQLSMPLTDYGRSRRNVEALQKGRRAIEQERDDTLRIAIAEFQSLQEERIGAERQVRQLETLLQSSKELLRVNEKGFESGALTLLESLEAARSLREIEEALLDARLRLATIDVALMTTEGFLVEEGS